MLWRAVTRSNGAMLRMFVVEAAPNRVGCYLGVRADDARLGMGLPCLQHRSWELADVNAPADLSFLR
jgi:hypothetical protein